MIASLQSICKVFSIPPTTNFLSINFSPTSKMSEKKFSYKIIDALLVLLIFKIFGFGTLAVSDYDVIRTGTFSLFIPSKGAKIYNICVFILLLVTCVGVIYNVKSFEVFFQDKITTVTAYTDLSISFLAALSGVCSYTVNQKCFVDIINRLVKIDSGLNISTVQLIQDRYYFPIIAVHLLINTVTFFLNYPGNHKYFYKNICKCLTKNKKISY